MQLPLIRGRHLAAKASFLIVAASSLGGASAQTCEQVLEGTESSVGMGFGQSVAVDGSVALVGARRGRVAGAIVGAAYVLERDPINLQWNESQRLVSSNLTPAAEFGGSVAVDGDVLVVGAPVDDVAGPTSGAVYVFERAGGAGPWVETQVLLGSQTNEGDEFGSAVAVSGDVIVVGAPRAEATGSTAVVGEVTTFLRDASSGVWHEVERLQPSGLVVLERFGAALEIDGTQLAVGRIGSSLAASAGGAVDLYDLDPTAGTVTLQQTLAPADLGTNHLFGRSIDIAGQRMVVGARSNDLATWSGSAYVFDRMGTNWVMTQKLIASDGGLFDQMGTAVALDGGRVLAGSPGDDDAGGNAGAVYEFTLDPVSGVWAETDKFTGTDVDGTDAYGTAIGLGATTVFVGAPGKDSLVYRGGVVYASLDSPGDCDGNGIPDACEIAAGTAQDLNGNFVLDSCEVLGVALCSPAVANSTGAPSELWAFGSDTAADNNLELHVIGLPTQTLGYFLVSPDMGFAANPGGSTGNLCIVGPSIGRYAGDVQSSGNGAKVMFTPDLTFVPQPNGNQSTSAGQTWCFQYWHRDFAMGSVTSNFSDARCITYL